MYLCVYNLFIYFIYLYLEPRSNYVIQVDEAVVNGPLVIYKSKTEVWLSVKINSNRLKTGHVLKLTCIMTVK